MTARIESEVAVMDGVDAPPRDNGELVFQAPWEARAFALALAVVDHLELSWDAFRLRLIEQIRLEPDRAYYESWARALESLVIATGVTDRAAIDAATPEHRRPL